MRTLGFCDPGLDRVSIAVFRFQTGPRQLWDLAPMQDKLRTLVAVRVVKTAPALSLPERLLAIGRGVHAIITGDGIERFYMETPRFAGTYRNVTDRQGASSAPLNAGAMMKTHYASGAILCSAMTVIPHGVQMVKAFPGGKGNSKADRLERVRMLLVSIGRRAEIRNADDLDAIALGLGTDWPR